MSLASEWHTANYFSRNNGMSGHETGACCLQLIRQEWIRTWRCIKSGHWTEIDVGFPMLFLPSETASRMIKRWFICVRKVQGDRVCAMMHLYYKSHPEPQLTGPSPTLIRVALRKEGWRGLMVPTTGQGRKSDVPHEFCWFLHSCPAEVGIWDRDSALDL